MPDYLRAQGSSVVVTTVSQLDVIAGVGNSADKARLDHRSCHTSDHDRGLAEETREGGINMEFTIPVRRESSNEKKKKKQVHETYDVRTKLGDHFLLH